MEATKAAPPIIEFSFTNLELPFVSIRTDCLVESKVFRSTGKAAAEAGFVRANILAAIFGHAALLCATGCGAHRRVSCVHAKFIFMDRARRVHCGHSCFWSSHHHGLSPTAHAPKFRRAALV